MRFHLAFILLYFSVSATQSLAAACSQLPHGSWPPLADARRFSASIGNHEGVSVRYYMDSQEPARVIEITRYGFAGETQYLYRSDRDEIAVSIKGRDPESTVLLPEDPRYVETLLRMRDLVGYAGGPQRFTSPQGSPALIYEEAILLVGVLDERVADLGPQVFNCIIYDASEFPGSGNSCRLTNGPLGSLGSWDARARAVWVRRDYDLILVDRAHFDKQGGVTSFLSSRVENDPSLAREVDGGFFYVLHDAVSLEASSLLCQRSQP